MASGSAIIEEGIIKADFEVVKRLTHSETLLAIIKQMLDISQINLKDIDAIACSAGPGSFTGLRIGVALAKGIALALNIPVIKISTLDAMGLPLSEMCDGFVCPLIDARNKQVYCASYLDGRKVIEESALDIGLFIKKLYDHIRSQKDMSRQKVKVYFHGDGAKIYQKVIWDLISKENESTIGKTFYLEPEFVKAPFDRERPASVAYLGEKYYNKWLSRHNLTVSFVKSSGADGLSAYFDNVVQNSDQIVPIYLRKSQAEQKKESETLLT